MHENEAARIRQVVGDLFELAAEIDSEATPGRPFNHFYAATDHELYWSARRVFAGGRQLDQLALEEAALDLARRAIGVATRAQ